MRGEDQSIPLCNVAAKLCDHGVGMARARHDGVAVVPQHMRVNRVDFRNLYIKRICCLLDEKFHAADGYLAGFHHIGDFVDGGIKGVAERAGKIVDQGLAAAALGIGYGVLRRVLRNAGQERAARAVVRNQHTGHWHIF